MSAGCGVTALMVVQVDAWWSSMVQTLASLLSLCVWNMLASPARVLRVPLACGAGGHGLAAAAAQDELCSCCCHLHIWPPGPNGQDRVGLSMCSQHTACTCASTCEPRVVCVLEKYVKPRRAGWYQLLIYHGKLTCFVLIGPPLNFSLSVALSESFIPRK